MLKIKAAPSLRPEKMATQLARSLAIILQERPILPVEMLVTIQDVSLSRDFSHAKIRCSFVNALESSMVNNAAAIKTLNEAAGLLRFCLSKRHTWRVVPKLKFYDESEHNHKQAHLLSVLARVAKQYADS